MTTFPFPELYGHEPAHVQWVQSQRDPQLWHAFTTALVAAGDPLGFLPWVFQQPETDRATAGYVFLGLGGNGYLQGQNEFGGEGLSDAQWLAAMTAVCRRAASTGFSNDGLGLAAGFEQERRDCLDTLDSKRVADGVLVPTAVLEAPFPAERAGPYFVEDGALLDYDPTA